MISSAPIAPISDCTPSGQESPKIGIHRRGTEGSSQSSSSGDERETRWSTGTRQFHSVQNIPNHRPDNADSSYQEPIDPRVKAARSPSRRDGGEKSPGGCWERQTVLSLDGGGIRGLSELLILKRIMDEIQRQEWEIDGTTCSADPDLASYRDDCSPEPSSIGAIFLPCHYFDYICGTSLGGIIAILLGRLRLSVAEAIAEYETLWTSMANAISQVDRVLPGNTTKSECTRGLSCAIDSIISKQQSARALQSLKGSPDKLNQFRSESALCRTLVLAVQYDDHARRPYLFRSYKFTEEKPSSLNRNTREPNYFRDIKDVCIATSASPVHFKSHRIEDRKYRDGSLWMANPSMELYREVDAMHSDVEYPLSCFVSIGCGKQKRGYAERAMRALSPGTILKKTSGYDSDQLKVNSVLQEKRNRERFRYFRIEGPPDLIDVKPSDWKFQKHQGKICSRIEKATESYCKSEDISEKIKQIAKFLVDNRRTRARTAQWEKYVGLPGISTIKYTCHWCNECDEVDRYQFMDHIRKDHKDRGFSRDYEDYRKMLVESKVPSVLDQLRNEVAAQISSPYGQVDPRPDRERRFLLEARKGRPSRVG